MPVVLIKNAVNELKCLEFRTKNYYKIMKLITLGGR